MAVAGSCTGADGISATAGGGIDYVGASDSHTPVEEVCVCVCGQSLWPGRLLLASLSLAEL